MIFLVLYPPLHRLRISSGNVKSCHGFVDKNMTIAIVAAFLGFNSHSGSNWQWISF